MVTQSTNESDSSELVSKDKKEKFYIEVIDEINLAFREWKTEKIFSDNFPLPKELLEKLELSIHWEYFSWEQALNIADWKFFIFWDEFTESEIEQLCISFCWEKDLDFLINLHLDTASVYEIETPRFVHDILAGISTLPSYVLSRISKWVSGLLDWYLATYKEQRYIMMLGFAVNNMKDHVNYNDTEGITDVMKNNDTLLLNKLGSLSIYSDRLDISINSDGSVESCWVLFSKSEWNTVISYFYQHNESWDV